MGKSLRAPLNGAVENTGLEQLRFNGVYDKMIKVITQFQKYGFVNINVVDNGTRLAGTFYDSLDGNVKDNFTIIKERF
jgi:hypothetical protein